MADDEVQPPPAPRDVNALRSQGRRRDPATIEGTAEELRSGAEPRPPATADATAEGGAPADPARAEGQDTIAEGFAAVPPDAPVLPHQGETAAEVTNPEPDAPMPTWEHGASETPSATETRSGGPTRTDDPAPPRRSWLLPALGALGLLLAILLGGVLYQLGNPPPNPTVTALTDQVNALAGRVSALEAKAPAPAPDLRPLADRIAALEARPAAAPPQPGPDLKPVEDRLAALDTATAQSKSDLGDLRAKLDQVAAAPQAQAGPTAPPTVAAAPTDLGPLEKQVADLSDGLKSLGDKVAAFPTTDLGPVQKQVADLSDGLKSLAGRVDALPKVDLAPLGGRVDGLDGKLAGVAAALAALPRVDLAPVEAKVDALDHRLVPIEAALSAPKAGTQVTEVRRNGSASETRAPPLAVTGQAILGDLDAGRPFAPAVAALETLGADDRVLGPLRAVADRGAPTRADLLAAFAAEQRVMVGAGTPAPGGSVLDRMVAGAQSLVKVRPAGSAPEKDPDAVVSRIGDDLQKGDDAGALEEWVTLPEDGRAASKAFFDRLKARVEAVGAARAVVADAIASLGAPGAAK